MEKLFEKNWRRINSSLSVNRLTLRRAYLSRLLSSHAARSRTSIYPGIAHILARYVRVEQTLFNFAQSILIFFKPAGGEFRKLIPFLFSFFVVNTAIVTDWFCSRERNKCCQLDEIYYFRLMTNKNSERVGGRND